ncbi:MAG: dodecin family protein [Candidatus Brocadiia bacterium]
MSVAKVVEISATSEQSFEDAIRRGIRRTAETVEDIQGAWIKEQKVDIEDGEIVRFRVDMKITFIVHE